MKRTEKNCGYYFALKIHINVCINKNVLGYLIPLIQNTVTEKITELPAYFSTAIN